MTSQATIEAIGNAVRENDPTYDGWEKTPYGHRVEVDDLCVLEHNDTLDCTRCIIKTPLGGTARTFIVTKIRWHWGISLFLDVGAKHSNVVLDIYPDVML